MLSHILTSNKPREAIRVLPSIDASWQLYWELQTIPFETCPRAKQSAECIWAHVGITWTAISGARGPRCWSAVSALYFATHSGGCCDKEYDRLTEPGYAFVEDSRTCNEEGATRRAKYEVALVIMLGSVRFWGYKTLRLVDVVSNAIHRPVKKNYTAISETVFIFFGGYSHYPSDFMGINICYSFGISFPSLICPIIIIFLLPSSLSFYLK
jgi:hypothetical protein